MLWKITLVLLMFVSKPAAALAIVSDSEIESGIRQLVNPIIKAGGIQPDEVKIYILLDDEVNAFVPGSGGKNIFIHAGLIRLFNDPDVLRGVIAHELGHIMAGHVVRTHEKMHEVMKQSIFTSLLGAGMLIAGAGPVGLATMFGGMHAAERSFMSHSRSQETAADQIAVRLLHATGNTVAGMLKFFDHSMRKQFSDEYQTYQYAMTHPLGKDRLNTMRVALQTEHNRYGSTELERKVYSRIVAKLNALLESPGTVLKLNRKNLDPFARNYEIAIALYRLSQFTEAVRKIDELIAIEPNNPYLYQIKGQFLFEHGKGLEAVRAYQKALEYLPNDILLIAEYAVTLVNSVDLMKSEQDKQEALTKVIKLLKRVTDRDLKNPYIYRNLAIAYGKLGDLANSNLMLAEEALEYGRIEEAHRFALKAKKHCSHDAKVKLKIDDILKALQDARNDDRRSGH